MHFLTSLLCVLAAGQVRAPAARGVPSPAPHPQAAAGEAQPAPPAGPPRQPPSTAVGATPSPALPAAVPPRRFGRFDLDQTKEQLARLPDLKACAEALAAPSGHAECALLRDADRLGRLQVAWEDSRPGGEIVALRLIFDPALAPALTDLEWQLTRGWGAPVLEQLRRERDQKIFTLQWEDAEHRATLEAQGALLQPSRAVAVVLERRPSPPSGDLLGLHPRPFPGLRIRWARRIDWESQPHAVVWGTNLSPAQEAMGEAGPAWATQRSYVGLWKLEPATAQRPRRWRPIWERTTGGDEDDDSDRVARVDTKDVTGDGAPDVEVELSCETCGNTRSGVLVKTVRGGKIVDLLSKRDLYKARVEILPLQIRIREPEGENDQAETVSTYAYDRGKGAFVLAREERVGAVAPAEER